MTTGVPIFRLPLRSDDGDQSWRDRGLCLEVDAELFFPDLGDGGGKARAVCRSCEVRVQCLGFALDFREEYGIWGGLGRDGRVRAARDREAGRSLEDILAEDDARYYERLEAAA